MSSEKEPNERVLALEQEIVTLKQELKRYHDLVDGQLDTILANDDVDNTNEREELNEEKTQRKIDWRLIIRKLSRGEDDYITDMIHRNEIDMIKDTNPVNSWDQGYNVWLYACWAGRIKVVKTCVNLGVDIHFRAANARKDDGLQIARSGRHHDIVEYLVLESMGGGTANEIVRDCDKIWREDGVVASFLNEIGDDSQFKEKFIDFIGNMLKQRNPVSSFLINVCLTLNAAKTWTIIKDTLDDIIGNTGDTLGWYYLNEYLIKNNTFLFRKYKLNKVEEKEDTGKRSVEALNSSELIRLFKDVFIPNYNQTDREAKRHPVEPKHVAMMTNKMESEQLNGAQLKAMDKYEFLSFLESSGMETQGQGCTRWFAWSVYDRLGGSFDVPLIPDDVYAYDHVYEAANIESQKHAENELRKEFEREEQDNAKNWNYVVNYSKDFTAQIDTRLRQDTIEFGVKARYSKKDIIQNMSDAASFNAIKFYDLEIYLNELMLRCGMMNDQFQNDVSSIFQKEPGVSFRPGPLKTLDRCKIKTETDYYAEEFPNSACLLDIVRCTVSFDDFDAMIRSIQLFEKTIASNETCLKEIMRVKNGFTEYQHTNPQYVDIKFNVRVNINGKEVIGEVQFLLAKMARFKVKAHKFYNVTRKKMYFGNLVKVRSMKNNLYSKLMICAKNGNHKGIKSILIKERMKSLSDLKDITQLSEVLYPIYRGGFVSCLKAFVSCCNDKESMNEFLSMKIVVGNVNECGCLVAIGGGNLKMTKYILSLELDDAFLFNNKTKSGATAFEVACGSRSSHNVEIAEAVLRKVNRNKSKVEMIEKGMRWANNARVETNTNKRIKAALQQWKDKFTVSVK
eukprot:280124_1